MQVSDKNKSRHELIVLGLICGVAQLALAPNVALGNGHANFALIFTVCAAASLRGRSAVLAGFFAGLFFDLSTTGPIGLMAGCLTVVGFLMGSDASKRMGDDFLGSLVEFSVIALVVSLVYHLAMLAVGDASSLIDVIFLRTVPTTVLTILFFLPFSGYYSHQNSQGPGGLGGRGRAPRGGSHLNMKGL